MNDRKPDSITYARLVEMLGDPDVPKTDLLPYIRQVSRAAPEPGERAAKPVLGLGPILEPSELVTFDDAASEQERARADIGLGFLNWAFRARRRKVFDRRIRQQDSRPVVLAEGDSWFQFPIFLDDTIDWLLNDYTVFCLSGAGDDLTKMVEDGDVTDHLKELSDDGLEVRALLISGGGNDIVGDELTELLHDFSPGMTAKQLINQAEVDRKYGDIRDAYTALFGRASSLFPDMPILFHGYDYALPRPDQGFNIPPLDGWLGDPMREKGIQDLEVQTEIVRNLLDQANELFSTFDRANGGLPNVHFLDNRGMLDRPDLWHDEMHPTDQGFQRVATVFKTKLIELGV